MPGETAKSEVTSNCCSCITLKKRIEELEHEIYLLKNPNHEEKKEEFPTISLGCSNRNGEISNVGLPFVKCDLSDTDIERYSRQILLPEINPHGQKSLSRSSVLVVGVGGLGCPAALYLAAAGVGQLGLVDYDVVDVSNLQRQVLHGEDTEGLLKVESAARKLKNINSNIVCDTHNLALTSTNCMEIVPLYDIVLDCSDNVATRYLLNDVCLKAQKPLVSGSALLWEGQLTVYGYEGGPCYRCLYPVPPPAETVTNCSDAGVMGAITGVIGALQALEAIKIITGNSSSFSGKLLMYDGLAGNFRVVKLRGKKENCLCTMLPSDIQLQDYEQFCGSSANDKEHSITLLASEHRLTVYDYYNNFVLPKKPHVLLDVRPTLEFAFCSFETSINIPLDQLRRKNAARDTIMDWLHGNKDVFVLCKQGNDSQRAVAEILSWIEESGVIYSATLQDIEGGLAAWKKNIDRRLPMY